MVPAAPLMIAAVSPAQPAAITSDVDTLRAAATEAVAALDADVVVVLSRGEPRVVIAPLLSFAPLGAVVELESSVDADASAAIAAALGVDVVRAEAVDLTHSALAAQLPVGRSVVFLSVGGDASALAACGETLAATRAAIAVLAPGDLSAGLGENSPRWLVDGAVAWDDRARTAIASNDVAGLSALGPREAARVHASGWAPLLATVAGCAASGLTLRESAYLHPRGVGQLVAST